jgi:alpha-N-arabinofuranosidase
MIGAGALVLARSAPYMFGADSPADSRIEILLNEPLGTISSDIYGHFVEHLEVWFTTVFGWGKTPKFPTSTEFVKSSSMT